MEIVEALRHKRLTWHGRLVASEGTPERLELARRRAARQLVEQATEIALDPAT